MLRNVGVRPCRQLSRLDLGFFRSATLASRSATVVQAWSEVSAYALSAGSRASTLAFR